MAKYGKNYLLGLVHLCFFWIIFPVAYLDTKLIDRDLTLKESWQWYKDHLKARWGLIPPIIT